jgi:hypothetical protein
MTRRQVVMTRLGGPGHGDVVHYTMPLSDESYPGAYSLPEMFLNAADFHALGGPEQITVTIEAGDRLNHEGTTP